MASTMAQKRLSFLFLFLVLFPFSCYCQEIMCNGVIKSSTDLDFTQIHVQLVTSQGVVKETSDCAPNNGYFLIPVYDNGEYFVRIDPPSGWSFSPNEVPLVIDETNDNICSQGKDIVFTFSGFILTGQVITVGQSTGPAGVTVTLLASNTNEIIKKTLSIENGRYIIDSVSPGQYIIEGSHPVWKINKDQKIEFEVKADSLIVNKNIIVEGFDVKGRIESKGDPVTGVQFLLHPLSSDSSKVSCDLVSSEGVCMAVSGEDGVFSYSSLPPGDYKLVPHYERADSKFHVFPTQVSFTVINDSIIIEPKFEVHGFTVFGRIISSKGGRGLEGIKVDLGSGLQTVTDIKGHYQLINISAGSYTIKVSGESVQFDPVTMEISPSLPRLPDIYPSRFSVCGQIIITLHASQAKFKTDSCTVELVSDSNVIKTSKVDSNGKFCIMLPPGHYDMKVGVSSKEAELGLSFTPHSLPVQVSSEPIKGLEFKQFISSITGTLYCIGKCHPSDVHLTSINGGEQKRIAKVNSKRDKGSFKFDRVLPGEFKVSVDNKDLSWCWIKDEMIITVPSSSPPPPLSFNQSGFLLNIQTSHDTQVKVYRESEYVFSLDVKKGTNKHCVENVGQYMLIPSSCYQFKEDMFMFMTDLPDIVILKAVTHTVNVSVHVPSEEKEIIKLGVKTSRNLKALTSFSSSLSPEANPPTTIHHYSFIEKPGTSLTLIPQTSELLCSPEQMKHVVGKECPEVLTPFNCRRGSFISGHIEPPLVGVSITIATDTGDMKVTTDEKGQYKVGPLSDNTKYTVVATFDGYVLEPLDDDPYSFKAMKKSQLIIKVNYGEVPLVGVFVSLSGDGLRNSSSTDSQGTVVYKDISPGQYYIKPLLREYEFQPSSKVVTLSQGDDASVDFLARRVAFSCTGKVVSLNQSPLEGVKVELLVEENESSSNSPSSCKGYHETTLSDNNGIYRFRGLQPYCHYQLSLVIDSIVERGIPTTKTITLTHGDIEGADLMAILRSNKVYITGNVIINNIELLGYVKAVIYSDKYLESQLLSVPVDPSGFFHFSSIPLNPSKIYYIQVETHLSSQSYKVTVDPSTSISFTADRDQHFTFNMTTESIPLANGNGFKGSFVGIFMAIGAIFLLANFDKVLLAIRNLTAKR